MAARCISVTFNAADCDQIGLSNPPAPEIAAAKRLSAPCSSLPTTVLHAHSVLHDARILSRSSLIIMHCNHSKWGREGLGTAGGGTLTHFTLCKQARKPRSYASPKLCPPTYLLTHLLTGVKCRATSVAKIIFRTIAFFTTRTCFTL